MLGGGGRGITMSSLREWAATSRGQRKRCVLGVRRVPGEGRWPI